MLFLLSLNANAIIGAEKSFFRAEIASHTVALLNTQNPSSHQRCTGTLIAPNVVLTAAHCIPKSLEQFWVVTAPFEFTILQRHSVSKVIVHPKYNFYAFENFDIALIEFAGALPSEYKPTTWTTQFDLIAATTFLAAAGYGETAKGRGDQGELRISQLRLFNFQKWSFQLTADQSHSHGICFGDSGGPVYVKVGDQFLVLGIASAVLAQDLNSLPTTEACAGISYFNSTVYYRDWIRQALRELQF